MFVSYRGSILGLLSWQWRSVLLFALASTAVVLVDHFFPEAIDVATLPMAPVAVVGGAIGIFVSFRTNSAYDRWWEGRKLWGRLINSSRHFASQVLTYLPAPEQRTLAETLVRRHVAYVHALRVLLRDQSLRDDPEFVASLPTGEQGSDLDAIAEQSNPTHALLYQQLDALVAEADAGRLDALRLQSLDQTLRELLDIQGGCERIKRTPFPRGYGFIADRLIQAYGVLLPLGLVSGIHNDWVVIPLTMLVCMSFALISETGRVLEDPFTMFWPALPLSALSTTIEVNLRERLGDADLPPMRKPDARGVLM